MDRTIAQKCISVTCGVLLAMTSIPCPRLYAESRKDTGSAAAAPMDFSAAAKRGDSPVPAPPVDGAAGAAEMMAAGSSDQMIQSGDFLYFSVSPAEELSRDLEVDQAGKVSVPLIGSVQAAGLTTDELAKKITHALSRYVTSPKVDVYSRQSISKQIGVTGQVTFPGPHPYRANMHLLDVITLEIGRAHV